MYQNTTMIIWKGNVNIKTLMEMNKGVRQAAEIHR
jgi:hypothetical protein